MDAKEDSSPEEEVGPDREHSQEEVSSLVAVNSLGGVSVEWKVPGAEKEVSSTEEAIKPEGKHGQEISTLVWRTANHYC